MDEPTDSRLIEQAYAAALEPELWTQWSTDMLAAFGAQGSVFGTVDRASRGIVSAEFKFPDQDFDAALPEYLGEMAPHDPVLGRLLGEDPDGIFGDKAADPSGDKDLQTYLAWQEARLDIRHNLTAMAGLGGGLRSAIALHRSTRHDAFNDGDRRRLAAIAPHMGAALRLGLRHRQLLDEAWWEGLSVRASEAALLLDSRGCLIHLTGAAELLVAAGDAVTVRGNRLHPADPASEGTFRKAIEEATTDHRPRAGAVMLSRSSSSRSVYLLVHPLPRSRRHRAPLAAAALVRIIDPGRPIAPLTREQCEMFGLTGRERTCAELLLAGHTLETLAQVLSISRNTARNHLHALFRKTGTNRQADLLRLLMAIA